VNSLPKTVTRQRRDCDLNPTEPESSTLTTRLPSHPPSSNAERTGLVHLTDDRTSSPLISHPAVAGKKIPAVNDEIMTRKSRIIATETLDNVSWIGYV